MRYLATINYNGTNYAGWQIQPDAISIEEIMGYFDTKRYWDNYFNHNQKDRMSEISGFYQADL